MEDEEKKYREAERIQRLVKAGQDIAEHGGVTRSSLELEEQTPLSKLVGNKQELQQVFDAIHDRVHRSFIEDRERDPLAAINNTKHEIRRRALLCSAWFQHARQELGYGLVKTIDMMSSALRSELDGIAFDPVRPDGRVLWTPS
jgi:hypothetical protein